MKKRESVQQGHTMTMHPEVVPNLEEGIGGVHSANKVPGYVEVEYCVAGAMVCYYWYNLCQWLTVLPPPFAPQVVFALHVIVILALIH